MGSQLSTMEHTASGLWTLVMAIFCLRSLVSMESAVRSRDPLEIALLTPKIQGEQELNTNNAGRSYFPCFMDRVDIRCAMLHVLIPLEENQESEDVRQTSTPRPDISRVDDSTIKTQTSLPWDASMFMPMLRGKKSESVEPGTYPQQGVKRVKLPWANDMFLPILRGKKSVSLPLDLSPIELTPSSGDIQIGVKRVKLPWANDMFLPILRGKKSVSLTPDISPIELTPSSGDIQTGVSRVKLPWANDMRHEIWPILRGKKFVSLLPSKTTENKNIKTGINFLPCFLGGKIDLRCTSQIMSTLRTSQDKKTPILGLRRNGELFYRL